MTRYTIIFALLFAAFSTSQAQAVRRYHQSMPQPATTSLQITDLAAQVEVVKWEGSDILVEITVSSERGSTAILNHLQKEGRYDLTVNTNGATASVVRKLANRQVIKSKGADLDEQVHYKISVPDHINVQSDATEGFTKARK